MPPDWVRPGRLRFAVAPRETRVADMGAVAQPGERALRALGARMAEEDRALGRPPHLYGCQLVQASLRRLGQHPSPTFLAHKAPSEEVTQERIECAALAAAVTHIHHLCPSLQPNMSRVTSAPTPPKSPSTSYVGL
jgi:hypothetical protein